MRYRSKQALPTPVASRTQSFARLQCWDGAKWQRLDTQVIGQTSTVVRYVFPMVTTSRIRVLFTEPPILLNYAVPEQPGVYVSELEAYSRVPFQWAGSPEGTADSTPISPLVIEPKQTRIFSDVLTPTLIVAESDWAKRPCAAAPRGERRVRLQNGFLQLDVSADKTLAEASLDQSRDGRDGRHSRRRGLCHPYRRRRAAARGLPRWPDQHGGLHAGGGAFRVDLVAPMWDVSVFYELRQQDHFYHKWLTLTAKRQAAVQVLDVTVSALRLPRPVDLAAGENQELTYPITILDRGGFFSCAETIYWDHAGDELTYYPVRRSQAGRALHLREGGSRRLQETRRVLGRLRPGIARVGNRIPRQVSPIPACWPDVYCEGWSARVGLGELEARPQWMEHWMETASRLGIRYMDAFEPMQQAMATPSEAIDRWVSLATRNNIDTGWWIDHSLAYHYKNKLYPPFACRLAPEAERWFRDVVEFVRAHHLLAMHWGDFLKMQPCNETGHGHLPGKYSLYAQGQRILQFGRELRATNPRVTLARTWAGSTPSSPASWTGAGTSTTSITFRRPSRTFIWTGSMRT